MLKKILVATLLFYIFSLLQNSFLSHYAIFGSFPNLIFILFFLLIFFAFSEQGFSEVYEVILWAVLAGFFLDIFSYNFVGPSVAMLLIIGLLVKKARSLLRNTNDKFPFIYFLSLFIIFFVIFRVFQIVYLRLGFDARIFVDIIYNLVFAIIGFSIFKKITNVKKISG